MQTEKSITDAVELTESAAEQVRHLLSKETDSEGKGLRVFIERGGCSGLEYGMRFDHPAEGDIVETRQGIRVMLDPESLAYLKGSVVDFKDEINDSGFRLLNPNAKQSCGCGKSFEV